MSMKEEEHIFFKKTTKIDVAVAQPKNSLLQVGYESAQ
jgi:hypothetical protein